MLSLVENDTIKCPCALCRNYVRHKRFDVEIHLCKNGFRDDYRIWTSHGERHVEVGSDESSCEADHRLSVPFKPVNPDDYERVIKENEQLKQTNQILHDENGVNRALIMAMYADFGKEPPAELLSHLENIDARRQQDVGSSHGGSHSVDRRDESDDDDTYNESDADDDDDDDDVDDDASFEGNDEANPYLEDDIDGERPIEGDADDERAVEGYS
ncbi:late secretory pathway protein AVL9-like [Panicum virgatum]|uniref:late secretory pathway protein AVL9-like n=1 Tax=Panicum virgatum TaxID=38727 RepID=UPI0019D66142|nr:late secretory pathway protein AVL9-like [Panicum virgatum]